MRRVLLWLWKWMMPGLVSVGLIAFLIWRISWEELQREIALLDYPRLFPLTALFVLVIYLWDSVCFRYVYAQGQGPLRFRTVLRVRGVSYLFNPINYELGQAVFAWGMARAQHTSVRSALARAVAVSLHDIVILFSLGLVGSSLSDDPVAEDAGQVCAIALGVIAIVLLTYWLLPGKWHEALQESKWGAWTKAWSWRRSGILVGLRLVHFSLILTYAGIGLSWSGVPLDAAVVASAIPLVVLIDGLPIGISGIGTREGALVYFLQPEHEAAVVAFSLVCWSLGQGLGRVMIGAITWWLTQK